MPMDARSPGDVRGFSLTEILVALLLTLLILGSVFVLLQKGQQTFLREPEVSSANGAARSSLDLISQDLAVAGFATPPHLAVLWSNGGNGNPDGITIVYADARVPVSRPAPCAPDAPCSTIAAAALLSLDPFSFSPEPPNFSDAYQQGMTLFAIQGPNGDPECEAVAPGLLAFDVTELPSCTGTLGSTSGPSACERVSLGIGRARSVPDLALPASYASDVHVQCALVGLFHVVQYRVHSQLPAASPRLERRDVALDEVWSPVAANIEDLQFQYGQGLTEDFADQPVMLPTSTDPSSWVTRVRVTVSGRSESRQLAGASAGVYAADDAHLHRTFTTTVSLRNQLGMLHGPQLGAGIWN
jgi:type II secretory pathway pseudopilin PulG